MNQEPPELSLVLMYLFMEAFASSFVPLFLAALVLSWLTAYALFRFVNPVQAGPPEGLPLLLLRVFEPRGPCSLTCAASPRSGRRKAGPRRSSEHTRGPTEMGPRASASPAQWHPGGVGAALPIAECGFRIED